MFTFAEKADYGKIQKKLYLFAYLKVSFKINFKNQISRFFKGDVIEELESMKEQNEKYESEIARLKQGVQTCDNHSVTTTATTTTTTTTTTITSSPAVLILSTRRSTNVPTLISLDGERYFSSNELLSTLYSGNLNTDLEFKIGDEMQLQTGCGTIFKGEMMYFGSQIYKRQVFLFYAFSFINFLLMIKLHCIGPEN